jgi:hypothetical protein
VDWTCLDDKNGTWDRAFFRRHFLSRLNRRSRLIAFLVEIVWCDVCCVTLCDDVCCVTRSDVCWVSLCDVCRVTFCDVCCVTRFDVWDRLMISFMARAAFSADIAGRRRRPLWRLLLRYFIFGPVRMFWKLRFYNLLTTFYF